MNEIKRLSSDELVEKRRSTLLSRCQSARVQLDSLSLLDSSYDKCRETLRQWRLKMLDHINKSHERSMNQLNNSYEELNRYCLELIGILEVQETNDDTKHQSKYLSNVKLSLNRLRNAEFSFDFDCTNQLDGELELLKLSNPEKKSRSLNKSNIKCRLLVPSDRYVSDVLFYDDLITRIDNKTPECILICPFDLLNEILGNDEEVRILIDQTYLPTIGTQAQRMRSDYNLILLQPSQECCPQSTERVIRIISKDSKNILLCLEDIYTICNQLATPTAYCPYVPLNYNKSRIHLYFGYSDIPNTDHLLTSNDINKTNLTFSPPLINPNQNSSSPSSQHHFDRVLMPVSIHETVLITDMQAGALLGPKGERIQQLQRQTGAIVNITDSNDERRKRIVNIQGNQQQVNNALQAIRKLLMIGNSDDDGENSFTNDGGKSKKL